MTRALATAVSVLVLGIAGCGGDEEQDKEAYVKEFNKVGSTLQKTLTGLGTDITGSTEPKQISTKLDEGAKALEAAADELDGIEPPEDADASHDKIVSGVKDLAGTFRKGADQAESGDLEELTDTFQGIEGSTGAAKIQQAQKELRDKGYKVDQ